jgi:hypothetical protein
MVLAAPLTQVAFAASTTTTVVYDDFSGGPDGYAAKWAQYTTGPTGVPVGSAAQPHETAFGSGGVRIAANPFTMSYDDVSDHIKYLATSTELFPAPARGSIMIAADIEAQTPGAVSGHILPTTGRALLEGQQACATLHLLDFFNGGIFDWLISGTRACPRSERLFFVPDLHTGYTQIPGLPNLQGNLTRTSSGAVSRDFPIASGPHNYAIRYSRDLNSDSPDLVEWMLDGVVVATVRRAGVPLDTQNPDYYSGSITYPAVGPGEDLKAKFQGFFIGHGLFSLVDEFPFNQFPDYNYISIPEEERIFGQGAIGTFANVTVTTSVKG